MTDTMMPGFPTAKSGQDEYVTDGHLDSRLKGYFGEITHPTMNMERSFCINCGKPKGWVTQECSKYVKLVNAVFICDECVWSKGKPPMDEVDLTKFDSQL